MSPSPTTTVGPLGSTIHTLHANPETIAVLAAVDWNRHFRRVCLDPVRCLITLMVPSRLHDDLAGIFVDIVDIATGAFGRPSKGLLSTRLRGRGEPPGTGMEPDCAFYVRRPGPGLPGRPRRRRDAGRRVPRTHRSRPRRRGRADERRRGQDSALRGHRGAGVVAGPRPPRFARDRRGLSRVGAGPRAPLAHHLGGDRGPSTGRRVRGGGGGPAWSHARRAHRGGDEHRPPAQVQHFPHPGRTSRRGWRVCRRALDPITRSPPIGVFTASSPR